MDVRQRSGCEGLEKCGWTYLNSEISYRTVSRDIYFVGLLIKQLETNGLRLVPPLGKHLSSFLGFWADLTFNSYSYQVSPSIFSGFWAGLSVSSVRSRPSVSDAVSHMGKRWSGTIPQSGLRCYGQLDDPAWVEPQRPPRCANLSGRGRDPVGLPTMRAKHIRTWSGDLVEQCWAGSVRICVERRYLSDHCMPRPRTHCASREAKEILVA